jgi:hypothetical protein
LPHMSKTWTSRASCTSEVSGLRFVANDLDVVAVRANDEGRVVPAGVVWAQPGRAIVLAASLQCRAMERLDLLAAPGCER